MFLWLVRVKEKWHAREQALAEKDRQVKAFYSEVTEMLRQREEILARRQKDFDDYSMHVGMRSLAGDKRQRDLTDYNLHLDERAAMLNKMQKDLEAERESMLGKDNLEVKRTILLPVMRQRWEAEAKQIDAERAEIMAKTPRLYFSLAARKAEYEAQAATIKSKPANMGNQTLLIQAEARLAEIQELLEQIDKERAKPNAETTSSGVPTS